jgi:hypothetical protein
MDGIGRPWSRHQWAGSGSDDGAPRRGKSTTRWRRPGTSHNGPVTEAVIACHGRYRRQIRAVASAGSASRTAVASAGRPAMGGPRSRRSSRSTNSATKARSPEPARPSTTMAGPMRYCPACYAPNEWTDDRCIGCGGSLATDDSYEDRLIWALGHPDTATAMLAADVLARRGTQGAISKLIDLVDSSDPYRAAAAARALNAFAGDDRAAAALERCRDHPSALVRRAVTS